MGAMSYVCGCCGKGFKRGDNLKKHTLVHSGVRPFQCGLCGKSFREKNHLNSHTLLHTGERPYKCNYCHKTFNQNSNLKKHIKIHLNDRPYPCDVCGNKFTQQCYLNEHKKIHTGERSYECTDCGKKFKNSSHLKSHEKTHSDERPYKCSLCDKTFKYARNFSLHEMAHDGGMPCQCVECGRQFLNRNDLKLHMLLHSSVEVHECFVCGKAFQKIDGFKRHLQSHTGERPFTCTVCDEGFKSSTHLKFHKMLHTGEKPYTCEVCGNGFRSKSYLSSHMISHEKRSFECTVCKKSFKYKCNHKRHMKCHENEPPKSVIQIISSMKENPIKNKEVIKTKVVPFKKMTTSTGQLLINDEMSETISIVSTGVILEGKGVSGINRSNINEKLLDSSLHTNDRVGKRRQFKDEAGLKIRVKSCCTDYPYHCFLCKETFRYREILMEHLKFHIGDSNEENLCSIYIDDNNFEENFESNSSLELDDCLGSEHDSGNECEICGKIFERKHLLLRHMDTHHSNKERFDCTKCYKVSSDKTYLKMHNVTRIGRKKFACNVCDKNFLQNDEQKKPMKIHDSDFGAKSKHYSCSKCGLKFLYKHNLETHEVMHSMRNSLSLEDRQETNGKVCDKSNPSDDKKIIHALMDQYTLKNMYADDSEDDTIIHCINEKEMDLEVTINEMNAIEQIGVENFLVKHDTSVKTKVSCSVKKNVTDDESKLEYICGNKNSPEKALNIHSKLECGESVDKLNTPKRCMIVHTGSNPYECVHCAKKFKEVKQLNSHVKVKHTQFECKYCCETLVRNSNNMEHHCETHIARKQCYDDVYGTKVIRIQDFGKHEMQHVKEKIMGHNSSIESKCDKNVMNQELENLGSRVLTDTGIVKNVVDNSISYPFKCSVCLKVFRKRGNLKRHAMTHVEEQFFYCSSCGENFQEQKRDELEKADLSPRPRFCMVCRKQFTQKAVADRPVKIHENKDILSENGEEAREMNTCETIDHICETPQRKDKAVRISQNNIEVLDDNYSNFVEPPVEIKVGKIAIQTISFEAAMKRKQILKERRRHSCIICGKIFSRKSNLLRHLQCHETNKCYYCKLCKLNLKSKSQYNGHMLLHSAKSIPCNASVTPTVDDTERCPKILEQNENKESHSGNTVRINEQLANDSPVASQNTKGTGGITKRTGEQFLCSVCGVGFRFRDHLESHLVKHNLQRKLGYEGGSRHKIVIKSRKSNSGTECDISKDKVTEGYSENGITVFRKDRSKEKGNEGNSESRITVFQKDSLEDDDISSSGELEVGKVTVKTIPYSVALQRRLKTYKSKKRFTCSECGKDLCSKYSLQVHMRLHNQNKSVINLP